jgi:PST family polysaccharide transporter
MTVFSGGVGLAIQVIATVVLARLLTPRDFGLVAMVTTFSILLSNFGVNGITEALVQREQIDHTLASNLFWVNLGGGVLLTGGFAGAGSILAKFYGEVLVASIAAGISVSIFLTSVSVIHLALLKRAMLFSAVAKNDIVARAASVVVSILFGWAGWGYWALVLGVCALPLSTAVGAWFMCRWMPGRPRYAAGTGAMLKFALYTYGRFAVNYLARNTDNLLVGWRFGAPALGFYKKAYDLFSLSATQLVASTSVVAVSALSRVREDGLFGHGDCGRSHIGGQGPDSCVAWARLGVCRPDIYVFRAGNWNHGSLWHARMDTSFDWEGGSVVPLGAGGVECNYPVVYCRASLGAAGNCCGVVRVVLDADDSCDVVCG